MALRTRLTELLGIEHPIIQGGMAWTATAELAAAVSNAGGIGIIGAGHMPTEVLRGEIRRAKELTDKPFGVNLMLLTPHIDELVDMVIEEGVHAVTTGAGNPGKFMAGLKGAGIKVLTVVPSVALAKRMESIGADAVIGEGMEAGGRAHRRPDHHAYLTPQLVRRSLDPRRRRWWHRRWSWNRGGVCPGRRGSPGRHAIHVRRGVHHSPGRQGPGHQGKGSRHCSHRSIHWPSRTGAEEQALARDHGPGRREQVRRDRGAGAGKLAAAMRHGDIHMGSLMAGQASAMVCEVQPAGEIVSEMLAEAESVMSRLSNVLSEG